MNRLGTSLRGQTRASQRTLGCSSPALCEVHSARVFVALDTAAVVEIGYDFLQRLRENHLPNFGSDFAQDACSDFFVNCYETTVSSID